jgi:hypothetical protein
VVTDLLKFTLSLTIAGRSIRLLVDRSKRSICDLQSHGFSVEVVFLLVDDTALGGPNVRPSVRPRLSVMI